MYHNLGHWIGEKNEAALEAAYGELGRTRRAEKTPLADVVFALILLKEHLRDYVLKQSLSDSVTARPTKSRLSQPFRSET